MSKELLKNTVFIKRCEKYDRDHLSKLITEGMTRFNYHPHGKVMVKPNVVFAYNTKVFGDMAYTPPPFVGASLLTLSKSSGVKRIDMGENCAVGIPTDMNLSIGHKLGMPAITRDPTFLMDLMSATTKASVRKLISMRYFQDINHFLTKMLIRRI